MKNIDYKITNNFLNTVTEFYRLHGALYLLDSKLPWKKELEKIAGDRTALSAVSLDADIDVERLFENSTNEIKIPQEQHNHFKNYRRTKDSLETYFGSINDLSLDLFHKIHSSVLGIKYLKGDDILRKKTNKVTKAILNNGVYRKIELVIKTQPAEIEEELNELNEWILDNYKLLNPVLKAAIIYYLLAKIHPYEDGNGRTAKVFIHGILYQNNIDRDNILLIEEYYLKNRTQYFDILGESIETGELTEWLEFFANALLYGAIGACKLLYKLSGGTVDILNNKILTLNKNQVSIVDVLRKIPNSSGADIGREISLSRQYINKMIHELIDMKIIEESGSGSGKTYKLSTLNYGF